MTAALVVGRAGGPIVFRLFNGIQPLDADGTAALARLALRAIVPATMTDL